MPRSTSSLGIFDTVLVTDGVASNVEAHVARLDSSVRAVYGQTVRAGLEEAVHRKAAGLSGRQRLRIDAVPLGDDVLVRMTARPILDDVDAWALVPRVIAGGLGPHKWTDRRALDHEPRADIDLLVLDDDGSVLETGRANVFLVHDDGVHTPPLDGRILPGTGRARVIDQLLEAGISCRVRDRIHHLESQIEQIRTSRKRAENSASTARSAYHLESWATRMRESRRC